MDISPIDFVHLVLPVYKAMFKHIATSAILASIQSKKSADENFRVLAMVKHYTSVSFARLLVLAGRKLRLSEAHFEAALHAIMNRSGLILESNLRAEQVSCRMTSTLKV